MSWPQSSGTVLRTVLGNREIEELISTVASLEQAGDVRELATLISDSKR